MTVTPTERMHMVQNLMLFTTSRVKSLLHDFKTLEVWEEEIILNEGPFHQGNACVIRAIGIK